MKNLIRFVTLFALVFMLLFAVMPTMAQEATPEPAASAVVDNDTGAVVPADGNIQDLVNQYLPLLGAGALIALIVNVLKQVNIIKDGQAGTWSLGLNLLGLVALFLLKVFKPEVNPTELDATAGQLAAGLSTLFALFVQLGGAKWVHGLISQLNVPVIGKSFSK